MITPSFSLLFRSRLAQTSPQIIPALKNHLFLQPIRHYVSPTRVVHAAKSTRVPRPKRKIKTIETGISVLTPEGMGISQEEFDVRVKEYGESILPDIMKMYSPVRPAPADLPYSQYEYNQLLWNINSDSVNPLASGQKASTKSAQNVDRIAVILKRMKESGYQMQKIGFQGLLNFIFTNGHFELAYCLMQTLEQRFQVAQPIALKNTKMSEKKIFSNLPEFDFPFELPADWPVFCLRQFFAASQFTAVCDLYSFLTSFSKIPLPADVYESVLASVKSAGRPPAPAKVQFALAVLRRMGDKQFGYCHPSQQAFLNIICLFEPGCGNFDQLTDIYSEYLRLNYQPNFEILFNLALSLFAVGKELCVPQLYSHSVSKFPHIYKNPEDLGHLKLFVSLVMRSFEVSCNVNRTFLNEMRSFHQTILDFPVPIVSDLYWVAYFSAFNSAEVKNQRNLVDIVAELKSFSSHPDVINDDRPFESSLQNVVFKSALTYCDTTSPLITTSCFEAIESHLCSIATDQRLSDLLSPFYELYFAAVASFRLGAQSAVEMVRQPVVSRKSIQEDGDFLAVKAIFDQCDSKSFVIYSHMISYAANCGHFDYGFNLLRYLADNPEKGKPLPEALDSLTSSLFSNVSSGSQNQQIEICDCLVDVLRISSANRWLLMFKTIANCKALFTRLSNQGEPRFLQELGRLKLASAKPNY